MTSDGDNPYGSWEEGEMPATRVEPTPSPLQEEVSTDPNVGAVFGGRFVVEEKIGGGGMGVVYRARRRDSEDPVVIKLLSREHLDDSAAVQRFDRESRILSRLDHPNIVSIFDYGTEGDASYIAMEYVQGVQLGRAVQSSRGFGLGRFLRVSRQLFDAVGQAHREGLVHRDLKPSNIMLARGDEDREIVKVLDFGLAKLVSGEEDVTKQESVVGSMPYVAPEQIQGTSFDERIDVYSLGIVLYYMLAARKPFRGENSSILYDQVHASPPPLQLQMADPESIPEDVFELIDDCLSKDPAGRPQDAAAVLRRLTSIEESTDLAVDSGPAPSSWDAIPETTPADRSSSEFVRTRPETSDEVDVRRESSRRVSLGVAEGEPTEEMPRAAAEAAASVETKPAGEEKTSWSWQTAVSAVSAAVALAGLAILLGWSVDRRQEGPGTTEVQQPDPVERRLDRVDRLIAEGELDGAERVLENAITSAENPDRYEARLSRAERHLHVAEMYGRALDAMNRREFERAGELLDRIDQLEPNFRRTAELQRQLGQYGRLRVDLEEARQVYVDGRPVGTAPVEVWLGPGEHDIRVERPDYGPWRDAVRLGVGETVSLEPELDPMGRPHPPARASRDSESAVESQPPSSTEPTEESAIRPIDELMGTSDEP